MSEANKAVVQRMIDEIWNKGNTSVVNELWNSDATEKGPNAGAARGPQAHLDVVSKFRTAFPDLNITVDEMTTEGDNVVTRFTATGTHKGNFEKMPATGKQIRVPGIATCHIINGKCAESKLDYDRSDLERQLIANPRK